MRCSLLEPIMYGGARARYGEFCILCALCSTSAVVRNHTCLEHKSNALRGECLLERLSEDKIFMDLLL